MCCTQIAYTLYIDYINIIYIISYIYIYSDIFYDNHNIFNNLYIDECVQSICTKLSNIKKNNNLKLVHNVHIYIYIFIW